MEADAALLLLIGGLFAGIVNTLAGGGSLLTVPLLVLAGVPGLLANGTNRVGVLFQSLAAVFGFRKHGIEAGTATWPVVLPVTSGSLLGAYVVSSLSHRAFEALFGVAMIVMLFPLLWSSRASAPPRDPWPGWLRFAVFFLIGLYGGAVQAGIGILLILALSQAGYDLVVANSIKVLIVTLITAVAVAVFIARDQVLWLPALFLTLGSALGGWVGARLAVRGGERVIRPVLVVSVLALAGRMFGFY